ncbi:hypothetical protein BYT27DRAFT_7205586 [Phlegmacium glaucopus]|nr:hypothetical protein BYT27DRAFT_7205586 [Phlegmacium glaucopus]
MDKHLCLKDSDVVIPDGDVQSSSDDDEDDDSDHDDEDDDEEEEERDGDDADVEHDEADEEEVLENTPESMEDQSTTKIELIDEGPTQLSQDELRSQATAFMGVSKDTTRSPEDIQCTPLPGETLAMFYTRSREYWTQKAHGNTEVEKILEEARLDEEEMRRGATGGGLPLSAGGVVRFSRNRR